MALYVLWRIRLTAGPEVVETQVRELADSIKQHFHLVNLPQKWPGMKAVEPGTTGKVRMAYIVAMCRPSRHGPSEPEIVAADAPYVHVHNRSRKLPERVGMTNLSWMLVI